MRELHAQPKQGYYDPTTFEWTPMKSHKAKPGNLFRRKGDTETTLVLAVNDEGDVTKMLLSSGHIMDTNPEINYQFIFQLYEKEWEKVEP